MSTTNFSIRRLAIFAKSEIMSQKRMWLLWWGTVVVVMLVLYLYYVYCAAGGSSRFLFYDPWASRFSDQVSRVREVVSFMSTFIMVMLIARSFSNYLQPQSASRLLMMPVSKTEQFSFIILFYFVAIPIVLFVTHFMIDLCFATYYGQGNLLQSIIDNAGNMAVHRQIIRILQSLLMFSIFLLGGIFFRRHNFTLTCLVFFGASMALFGLFSWIGATFGESVRITDDFIDTNAELLVTSAFLIFSAIMIFLAYRRFLNFQITK